LLSNAGYRTLVLEAAHLPGGCSSSFKKRGGVYETGATTLIGLDPHQPLHFLQHALGITLPAEPISPSMVIDLDRPAAGGRDRLVRHQDLEQWIEECVRVFGQPHEQREFWRLAKRVADTVWRVSLRNPFFPPRSLADAAELLRNRPTDAWILPHAMHSVRDVAMRMGLVHPDFIRLLDEQLLISSQAHAAQTPFLFGAPALTYTNYTNFYVPGGLLELVRALQRRLEQAGGELLVRRKVVSVEKQGTWIVRTANGETHRARHVVSNVPVWNMPGLTAGAVRDWFDRQSRRYASAWGALTFTLLTSDPYPDGLPLHRQIHLPGGDAVPGTGSRSIFVSISKRGDLVRAPEGHRAVNVSTHADPEAWFALGADYDGVKARAHEAVHGILRQTYPGFADAEIRASFAATPVTWQKWVHRRLGRVGGIPQSMSRSLLDWTPSQTPFDGLWLCGDTVYPGQGIPGVTLSGINVYSRIMRREGRLDELRREFRTASCVFDSDRGDQQPTGGASGRSATLDRPR